MRLEKDYYDYLDEKIITTQEVGLTRPLDFIDCYFDFTGIKKDFIKKANEYKVYAPIEIVKEPTPKPESNSYYKSISNGLYNVTKNITSKFFE